MSYKYWIILDWAGGPLKSDSDHKGWYEIESFSLDIATRGGPRSDGAFGIQISVESPSMILAPILELKLKTGDPFDGVAIDMMKPDRLIRNEFRNVRVDYSLPAGRIYEFHFEFGSMVTRQVAIPRSRAATL